MRWQKDSVITHIVLGRQLTLDNFVSDEYLQADQINLSCDNADGEKHYKEQSMVYHSIERC